MEKRCFGQTLVHSARLEHHGVVCRGVVQARQCTAGPHLSDGQLSVHLASAASATHGDGCERKPSCFFNVVFINYAAAKHVVHAREERKGCKERCYAVLVAVAQRRLSLAAELAPTT